MRLWRRMTVAVAGIAILTVAAVSLIGHAAHDSGYYQWWGDPVGMATNTALCFLVTGCALVIIGLSQSWH